MRIHYLYKSVCCLLKLKYFKQEDIIYLNKNRKYSTVYIVGTFLKSLAFCA
jgi:hypothetical protein